MFGLALFTSAPKLYRHLSIYSLLHFILTLLTILDSGGLAFFPPYFL